MSAALKSPAFLTVTEFMASPDDPTGTLWQLVDGEPMAMAPASDRHGSIQAMIGYLLTGYLLRARPGCRVVVAPGIVPRANSSANVRIPDLAVTCSPVQADTPFVAQPMLVVEIMSPSNHRETWSNVWTYCSIPSVTEILIVQSTAVGAELLRRQPDGSWPALSAKIAAHGDMVILESIGAAFELGGFYRGTDFAAA